MDFKLLRHVLYRVRVRYQKFHYFSKRSGYDQTKNNRLLGLIAAIPGIFISLVYILNFIADFNG